MHQQLHRRRALLASATLATLSAAAAAQVPQPLIAGEEAKLVASDGAFGDRLGETSSVHGDTAVVGTSQHAGAGYRQGAAYVFVRAGSSWSEQAKLVPSDPADFDGFGKGVSVDGDTLAVGSPGSDHSGASGAGAVYVFVRSGTTWAQQAKLVAGDPSSDDHLGWTVSLSADTLVAGAWGDDRPGLQGAGAAYVFVRSGTTWSQQAKLTASDAADNHAFGWSVSADGDAALVGATGAVAAYAFGRAGTSWTEAAVLVGSTTVPGDGFGGTVALSGDRALVGARSAETPISINSGSATFFVRAGTSWSEQQTVWASDGYPTDLFGHHVALHGQVAAIGAPFDDEGHFPLLETGSVYVFAEDGGEWSEQVRLSAADAGGTEWLGWSVAISGDTVIGGAYQDAGSAGQSGSANAFRLYSPSVYCTAGTSANGCRALVRVRGLSSATRDSGFHLEASEVPGLRNGIFFFGVNGRQASPWGNGSSAQCVAPPVKRVGLMVGEGTPGLCDSIFSRDLNARWCPTCPKPGQNPGAGAVVQAQLWYRDPLNTSNQTTSLSDAVEFVVGP